HGVSEVRRQHVVAQVTLNLWRLDREQHFHPALEVPLHRVSAPEIDQRLATVVEVVDAAVFQKTSHHAEHPDRVANTLDARPETTDTAHDQINTHPIARGGVQRPDYLAVNEGVHLEDHVAVTVLAMALG